MSTPASDRPPAGSLDPVGGRDEEPAVAARRVEHAHGRRRAAPRGSPDRAPRRGSARRELGWRVPGAEPSALSGVDRARPAGRHPLIVADRARRGRCPRDRRRFPRRGSVHVGSPRDRRDRRIESLPRLPSRRVGRPPSGDAADDPGDATSRRCAASTTASISTRSPRSTSRSPGCSTCTSSATQNLHKVSATFLGTIAPKVPYVIGVAGSVAVGKSHVRPHPAGPALALARPPEGRPDHDRRIPAPERGARRSAT